MATLQENQKKKEENKQQSTKPVGIWEVGEGVGA